jgi:hypothetical protein
VGAFSDRSEDDHLSSGIALVLICTPECPNNILSNLWVGDSTQTSARYLILMPGLAGIIFWGHILSHFFFEH